MQKPAVDIPMVTIKSEIKTEIAPSGEETDQPSVTLPPLPTPSRVNKRKKSLTDELFNPDVKRKTKLRLDALVDRAVQAKSFDLEAELPADIPVYVPTAINPIQEPREDVALSPQSESSWKCKRCDYMYLDDPQLRLVKLIDCKKVGSNDKTSFILYCIISIKFF